MKNMFFLIFVLSACGPFYSDNLNNRTEAVLKNKNNKDRIIILSANGQNPEISCIPSDHMECSLSLYTAAGWHMANGESLVEKKLFLSAYSEYLHAMVNLSEAEIHIKKAKEKDLATFSKIKEMDLEKKIKERLAICKSKHDILKLYIWRP
jgi:hypothetical protein